MRVLATEHFGRYGIETKIDSVMDDETQSCVVISRGVEKYVTELAWDHSEPMHCDEMSRGTGRPVAFNPRRVQSQASP